jgi:hypothetical protein
LIIAVNFRKEIDSQFVPPKNSRKISCSSSILQDGVNAVAGK